LILYLDTSALVKLYAIEAGSQQVRSAVSDAERLITSIVAYPETRSALARKRRRHEITAPMLEACRREFDDDWDRIRQLPVDDPTVRRAGDLAEEHGLKGFDALHLASAELMRISIASDVTFACFDLGLVRAARRHGFSTL